MAKRYERVYSLPANQYAQGAPVILEAGALLRDNESGKFLAQLKIWNIQEKTIKAATVEIQPRDTVGNHLETMVTYQYLDLNESRDSRFGQQVPIILPDTARSYDVKVTKVIFLDNSIWDWDEAPWESLPDTISLSHCFEDPELQKQFKIAYGGNCWYQYQEVKDLWRCACGEWNRQHESQCHKCKKEAAAIRDPDWDALTAAKNHRLEQEAQEAAKAREEAAESAKKAKKIAKIAVPILVLVVIAGVLLSGVVKRNAEYQEYPAKHLIEYVSENGTYQENISLPICDDGFAGFSMDLSDSGFMEIGDCVQTITVEENDPSVVYYHNYTEMGDVKVELWTGLSCTAESVKLAYIYAIDGSVSLVEGDATLLFDGSIDAASYQIGEKIPMDDMWLESDALSASELERYPITEGMKDAYSGVADQFMMMYLYNFGICLQSYTNQNMADLGFSESIHKATDYGKEALTEMVCTTKMGFSFQEAYEQLKLLPEDSDFVRQYQPILEPYLPYCGSFTEAEVNLNGRESKTRDYQLVSDFYLSPEGDVYWTVSSSDGRGNLFIHVNGEKHYPFISAEEAQRMFGDGMELSYTTNDSVNDPYRCTAVFQKGEILITIDDLGGGGQSHIRYTAAE